MKSKSIFLIAVSLGFGLVAAIGITQVMGRSNKAADTPEVAKLPVLVAMEDLDINTELTPEMFSEEQWPAEMVPEGIVANFEEIKGKAVTARVGKKGTVFLSSLIDVTKLRDKMIPAGYKVIGIKMGADDHLYGLLEPGDLVDIIGVFRGSRGGGSTSRTFLRAIRVWSIAAKTKKDVEQNPTAKGSTVIGLLVTEKQSEQIVLGQRIAELKLAMRSQEEADAANFSAGTGFGDFESGGNSGGVLRMFRDLANQGENAGGGKAAAARDQWTVTVHTSEGPTQYHFDRDAGIVPTKIEGFAGQPGLEGEGAMQDMMDLEGGSDDTDSDSLIEDLDSEPSM
ncbi:MAG: Flp pilus assembly protein CpaB [Pirellulaceae bacterium]